jgi:polyhydroxybutyrate depolymerase
VRLVYNPAAIRRQTLSGNSVLRFAQTEFGLMQLSGLRTLAAILRPSRLVPVLLAAMLLPLILGAAQANTEVRRIVVKGEQRTYRLHLPPNLKSAPVSLIVALHGAVQSAAEFESDLGMNRIARREGFAVVYPEGINRVWDDARAPIMRLGYVVRPGDDVPFIVGLVRQLIREGIADPNRIYLAGLSMGGFMTARLACEHSELFAAIAMMAATAPEQYRKTCRLRAPMPAVLIHGTFDAIIPWFGVPMGGQGLLSANDTAQMFADLAGCMTSTDSSQPSLDRSQPIAVRRWSICRDSAQVLLYTIPGGGHLPPSAEPGRGDTFVAWFLSERSHSIDAAEEIWKFFRQYESSAVN